MRAFVIVLLAAATSAAAQSGPAPRREIENVAAFARLYGVVRYFYPSDAAAALEWNRFAVHGVARVRGARDTAALRTALDDLFAPLGPGIIIAASLPAARAAGPPDGSLVAWRYQGPGISAATNTPYRGMRTNRLASMAVVLFEGMTPVTGAHVDIDLASGLKARVALALPDAEARTERVTLPALRAALATAPAPASGPADADLRLAGVVVAWNVFRHFYPYWTEAQVDWDARLAPQLEIAQAAASREAHRNALRALVADARDGHGGVTDVTAGQRGRLPIQVRVIEGRLAIIASSVPDDAPVGAIVTAIDGVPATERLSDGMRFASGTTQWKQTRAAREVLICSSESMVRLGVEIAGAPARETRVPCSAAQPPAEKRPDMIAELAPGIWYVDVTRATLAQIQTALPALAGAAGVVFDLRGYPTDAGSRILAHLVDAPESDRWMHVAHITGPFGEVRGWSSFGWNLKPATPHLPGKRVFLTDGRAISYAESVMGYVADRKLATIIGSATAGTNGNVLTFEVPGGFSIAFTGMRVTRHDGRTPFHLRGVQPDIPLEPTLAALREGRDELLERAMAEVRKPR